MPKPLIESKLVERSIIQTNHSDVKSSDFIFRKKRSEKYINIIKSLDIASHNISQANIEEIINEIKRELPEVIIGDLPIGIVAKCYLGEAYEVHTLSFIGQEIITHYKSNEFLPQELEKARTLANNPHYAFVEVYKDKIIAVKEDGSTSIVKEGGSNG